MKILLANIYLSHWAGSETWTMTMYDQLSKEHDVDVYVPPGEINNMINACCDRNKHYDLAIINHNVCLNKLRGWNISRRIFTSHGIMPGLDQPIPGADVYVSVSEEIQQNLLEKGFESEIIRNPIDTVRFPYVKPNSELHNILWMNNRPPNIELIERESEGYNTRIQTGWSEGASEAIQWADLVITSGRGIYEALSCGKNAMIVNWCGCDGFVTEENIKDLRKTNCSGRFYGAEKVRENFGMYDPDRNMRPYIMENNEVSKVSGRYLEL